MNNKINKLITETIINAKIIEMNITIEELTEKYNNIFNTYGEEKASQALQNTYKSIKEKTKEIDKKFWNSVRYEIFNKFKGSIPCSNRDLKSMIKNNEINIKGLSQETKIKELLNKI
jgi:hypothetical protein